MKKMMIACREMARLAANSGKKDGIIFGIVWNNARNWLWDNDDRGGLI